MNKVKVLSIISIGLLAANLLLLWFLMSNNRHVGRGDGPKRIIIEKLKFDQKQIDEYDLLIDWHRTNIAECEQQMMDFKNQLYSGLQEGKANSVNDSLITEIGKVQQKIEHVNYKHFQDIKNLCKPEQLKLFDKLSVEIAKLFAHKRGKGNAN